MAYCQRYPIVGLRIGIAVGCLIGIALYVVGPILLYMAGRRLMERAVLVAFRVDEEMWGRFRLMAAERSVPGRRVSSSMLLRALIAKELDVWDKSKGR